MSHHRIAAFATACVLCAAPVSAARSGPNSARHAPTAAGRKAGAMGEKARSAAAEKPTRTIAVAVNGEPLPDGVSAQVVDGRVLVPLRDVFAALGLDIERSGNQIRSRLPTGTVRFSLGSAQASVDERPVSLEASVMNLGGTTYVPLGLLSAALGAQATYDQRGAQVEIVSSLFGRTSGTERQRADGGFDVQGVVSAIDTDSQPPSITVVRGGTARTISITSGAKIWTEDVTIHNQLPGVLTDLRVGDALHAILARDGRVVSLFDYYRSTSGTVSAISPSALVLGDGRVVAPSGSTTITLGDTPAQFGDLRAGDYVTVRSNPESGELRSIVASRAGGGTVSSALPGNAATPASPANVTIANVALSTTRPLRAGESFDVTMKGTPGARASFDIGDYLVNLPMHETGSGIYAGRFMIPERFNLTDVPVYGKLTVGTNAAPRVAAPQTLSATTTPPAIAEVAPTPGQTINNRRPSIFATYEAPTAIGINTSSVRLSVNGHDVTSSATRMGGFIIYSPGVDLGNGSVSVVVKVSDTAGNTAAKTWSFTVKG